MRRRNPSSGPRVRPMNIGVKSRPRKSDQFAVEVCRVCGAECAPRQLRPVHEGGGCRSCSGSPACTRCAHPRRSIAAPSVAVRRAARLTSLSRPVWRSGDAAAPATRRMPQRSPSRFRSSTSGRLGFADRTIRCPPTRHVSHPSETCSTRGGAGSTCRSPAGRPGARRARPAAAHSSGRAPVSACVRHLKELSDAPQGRPTRLVQRGHASGGVAACSATASSTAACNEKRPRRAVLAERGRPRRAWRASYPDVGCGTPTRTAASSL
jgi:hypothetical protein